MGQRLCVCCRWLFVRSLVHRTLGVEKFKVSQNASAV